MIIQRTAVRALLLTEHAQLLLSRIQLPDSSHQIWIAPGGGVEPGETYGDALIREVWEETGHGIGAWKGPVWTRRHRFPFRGDTYDQSELFFLVKTPQFEPDHRGNPAEIEREIFEEFRWWSLAEIADSSETFVPGALARHLGELVQNGIPTEPIAVGV